MRTFADWKKENIDWDASSLDSATKKYIVDHMEKCWNDGFTVGLSMPGFTIDQPTPDRRAELLELASRLAVTQMERTMVLNLKPGQTGHEPGIERQMHDGFAKHVVGQAAAIIVEVDRVSYAPRD